MLAQGLGVAVVLAGIQAGENIEPMGVAVFGHHGIGQGGKPLGVGNQHQIGHMGVRFVHKGDERFCLQGQGIMDVTVNSLVQRDHSGVPFAFGFLIVYHKLPILQCFLLPISLESGKMNGK